VSEALNDVQYAAAKSVADAATARWSETLAELKHRGVRDGTINVVREQLKKAASIAAASGDDDPTGAFIAADAYDPILEAYTPWPESDLREQLRKELDRDAPVTMIVHTVATDGIRETIHLDKPQTAAYMRGDLAVRERMRTVRINERRLRTAIEAAARIHKSSRRAAFPIGKASPVVTPDEEMCLDQFGAIEAVAHRRVVESVGGTDEVRWAPSEARIREGWSSRARTALRERTHSLEPTRLREMWGYGDLTNETEPRPAIGGYVGSGVSYPSEIYRQYGPTDVQMQINETWDEIAKAKFAYTSDPICKSAIRIKSNFILGRGFSVVAKAPEVQAVIDEFDDRHTLQQKKGWHRSAEIMGDLFLRKQPIGDGRLKATNLPAQTIWEIVTLAEDNSVALYFIQRYRTRFQQFSQPDNPVQYIERMIPANEVLHFKLNADLGEVRGRSSIYAALPWHLKFRNHWEAQIEKDYASAAYTYMAKVQGNDAQVRQFIATSIPKTRPRPGSTRVFNEKVLEYKVITSDKNSPAGTGSTNDGILNVLAANYGFAKEYFGVSGNRTRGGAVIADGPAQKTFENGQDDFAELLNPLYEAVIDEHQRWGNIPAGIDTSFGIIFPDIIKADSLPKVQLMVVGRSQGFISHRSAAQIWAGALDLGDFDYDAEQQQIETERGEGIGLPAMPSSFNDTIDPKNSGQGGAAQDPRSASGAAAVRADDQHAAEESDHEELTRALETVAAHGVLTVMP